MAPTQPAAGRDDTGRDDRPSRPPPARLPRLLPASVAVILIAEAVLLAACLTTLMGGADALAGDGPGPPPRTAVALLAWHLTVNRPMLFVIVSLAGGALGGVLHSLASLTSHVAASDFGREWTMWYLVNPLVGALLALVFLFVLQAGLGGQAAGTQNGLYGIAATATLSGMFARHALAKLKDVFDVVFASRASVEAQAAPSQRAPAAPSPRVTALLPSSVPAGSPDTEVRVVADGLGPGAEVMAGTATVPVARRTAGALTVVVPAAMLDRPGRLPVRVGQAGRWSDAAELAVVP